MAGRGLRIALLALLVLAALGLAACGGGSGDGSTASGTTNSGTTAGGANEAGTGKVRSIGLVSAYCLYGADTEAQMLACKERTKAAQVRAADDEAARWARGELQTCGKSAGELCQYYRDPVESQTGGEGR